MSKLENKCSKIKLFVTDVDGVLTDAGMYYSEKGDELKKFSTLDGGGLILLQLAGIQTALITSENTEMVARRAEKLKFDFLLQGAKNKVNRMADLLEKTGFQFDEVAYIGDDINDLPLLLKAGLSASVPGNCLPAGTSLDYTTLRPGGSGAVRDFAEWLLKNRNDYEQALKQYLKNIGG